MAITRAQQAKQLLANGGGIGLKAGAQFDTSLGGGAISPGTDVSGQFRGGDGSGDGNRNKLTTTVKDLGKEVLPYVIGGPALSPASFNNCAFSSSLCDRWSVR